NVLAAWLGLEVASGNDAISSHSAIRKTAKLMGQFLPGTDFVTSGYSSMPRYDNMFGGGNYDSDDFDEWLTIQRDWQVDAGIEPLDEESTIAVRERAARAVQAVFDTFGFPAIIGADGTVVSAVNDANAYAGPGTGYRLEGERWERLQRLPHAIDARLLGAAPGAARSVDEVREATPGERPDEVVVAVGPAFGDALSETINGLAHRDVLAEIVEGIRDEGAQAR